MPEPLPDRPSEEHPIVAGLIALVGVGLVVGLVLGLVVIAGTKLLGLGDDSDESSASGRASMYLPTPAKTTAANEPQITLGPGEESESASADESDRPKKDKTPKREITLSASTTTVSPMEQFLLTGVYPQGEGAILTVQRFEDGGWQDFPATGSVQGESFQIPVQASLPGVNRFRVVDSDSNLKSDEVRITISGG